MKSKKLSILMVFLASRGAISFLPLPSAPLSASASASRDAWCQQEQRHVDEGCALLLSQPPIRPSSLPSQPCVSSPVHRFRRRIQRRGIGALNYASRPESEARIKDEGESTFWYTVTRRNPEAPPPSNGQRDTGSLATFSTPTHLSASVLDRPFFAPEDEPLPCVPTLDAEGPLPLGAYFKTTTTTTTRGGVADDDAKTTCKISVALSSVSNEDDITDGLDVPMQVRGMHKFVDSGFSSFQLPCLLDDESNAQRSRMDDELYRRFLQQTPQSVRDRVKVTVPVPLWQVQSTKSARAIVMDLMMRYRTDALDEVQLVFRDRDDDNSNTNSPPTQRDLRGGRRRRRYRSDLLQSHLLRPGEEYWLDALDALRELQRDGYVRAVSTRNVPSDALWLAEQGGLADAIGNNAADGSLLWKPGSRNTKLSRDGYEQQWTAYDFDEDDDEVRTPSTHLPTLVSSPLAGGLLTDRFRNCRTPMQVPNASEREQQQRRRHFHILQDYATRRLSEMVDSDGLVSEPVAWGEYQSLLESMLHISRGYVGSDTASLSLRWLLQQQQQQQLQTSMTSSPSPLQAITNVAGLVVSTRFYDPTREGNVEQQLARRIKSLRSVFTFRLSTEEMEQLNELSGWWREPDDRNKQVTNGRAKEEVRFL